ncbi:hypothetical protein J2Y66_003633 [Paenarthrobacter nitroguajacolicus]|uniref:PASTA domain-containing protein n=1 Tax=Paenarthrobacter nitroguajacolicus TaxID=211146 RepID=UPI002858928E|nr:PASTA domain-containing protein [Paenarthrobacter nitroguajacolicus]MDR6989118.1 hypothetical protein [Paenarthrobacter nitroguajacolicus]
MGTPLKAIQAAVVFATGLMLIAGVAGCSPGSNSPKAEPSSSTALNTNSVKVPDLSGRNITDATGLLRAQKLEGVWVGTDGVALTVTGGATVVETSPKAGTDVEAGSNVKVTLNTTKTALDKRQEEQSLAKRYVFECTDGSYSSSGIKGTFNNFAALWSSPNFLKFKSCSTKVGGVETSGYVVEPKLLASEQVIVDTIARDGGDVSRNLGAFADVLETCSLTPKLGWDWSMGPDTTKIRAVAKTAAGYCPTAPFINEISRVANGIPPAEFDDGTYEVGKRIQAGTYKVEVPLGASGVRECYWERTTPSGGIIANDFINYAPQAPAVTMYEGEGFVSERCGTWRKVG